MNVEDGKKDADSNCRSTCERFLVQVGYFDNLAIGRRNKQTGFGGNASLRIAKKRDDPEKTNERWDGERPQADVDKHGRGGHGGK